jgi:hypothetical protein
MGRVRALESLLEEALREARERGDRYLQASLIYGVGRFPALCDDDPDRATSELTATVWATPSGSYHLHRFLLLDAHADIALYQSAGERALPELEPELEALYGSPLLRAQAVRVQAYWLHARLLLQAARDAPARHLTRARELAQKLARERVAYAPSLSALVTAAVAHLSPGASSGAACGALRAAVESADACHQGLHATAARYRLGQLIGGDEGAALLAEADQWLKRERVRNPQRLVEMVAPGFPAA